MNELQRILGALAVAGGVIILIFLAFALFVLAITLGVWGEGKFR